MASISEQTVHTGATVLIKYNGTTIGRAQGFDARRSYGTEGVYEIGTIMPQEHVQNRYEGSFTLERYLMRNEDLVSVGLAKLGEDILELGVLDIEVYDKTNQNNIRVYRGCTTSDYSENIKANAIAGENATFYYLSCDKNEGENANE